MKTKLLLFLILPLVGFSQTLLQENYNGLTVANLDGQNVWETFSTNGAAGTTTNNANVSNFQVSASGNNSTNGLLIAGPNGSAGGFFAWQNGFPAAWSARASGNDIVEVEVSVNPGGTGGASRNDFGVYIYNADFSKVLAGIVIRGNTNVISLVAYSQPGGQPAPGNFIYGLAAAPGQVVTANTWSRFGVSYNTVTGQVLIDGDGITGPLGVNTNVPTDTPAEVDFVSFSGSSATVANAVSSTMIFDDIIIRAAPANSLLSIEELVFNEIKLYPNPANESIVLSSNTTIEKVEIINTLGQIVLQRNSNFQSETTLDISALESGLYLMNINSEDGKRETKKFFKN